jgi:hypothetical protein
VKYSGYFPVFLSISCEISVSFVSFSFPFLDLREKQESNQEVKNVNKSIVAYDDISSDSDIQAPASPIEPHRTVVKDVKREISPGVPLRSYDKRRSDSPIIVEVNSPPHWHCLCYIHIDTTFSRACVITCHTWIFFFHKDWNFKLAGKHKNKLQMLFIITKIRHYTYILDMNAMY